MRGFSDTTKGMEVSKMRNSEWQAYEEYRKTIKEKAEEQRLRDAEEANRFCNPDTEDLDIMETY